MTLFRAEEYRKKLVYTAQTYLYLNYSVIPVYGADHEGKEKVASVAWKQYQHRRASHQEINQWFDRDQFGGLAIVTGRISGIVVLDFDDSDLHAEFLDLHPHLCETYAIQTPNRNLRHYYYRLAPYHQLGTMHAQGVDLMSDGAYVLAPPTQLKSGAYRLATGGIPRLLTEADLGLIHRFFKQHGYQDSTQIKPSNLISQPQTVSTSQGFNLEKVRQHYLCQLKLGRNNALFEAGKLARDQGLSLTLTHGLLAPLHSLQPAPPGHASETPEQRLQEAEQTLKSVFSRPSRKVDTPITQIPNRLREALLQDGKMALSRVLDGLLLANVQIGDWLTEKQIGQLLKEQIGRYSILQALKTTLDDQPVFLAQSSPEPPSFKDTQVANSIPESRNNKCLLFRVTASDKNRRGRPARYYQMPDIKALCAHFGVVQTFSDPVGFVDLRTPTNYRMNMHRRLIERSPAQYSREWLAARLCVSIRTCQRYNAQDDTIISEPMYHEIPLTWDNFNQLLCEEPLTGVFLMDDRGKRYPALPSLARRLLRSRVRLSFMRQVCNFYAHRSFVKILAQKTLKTAQEAISTAFVSMRSLGALKTSQKSPVAVSELPAASVTDQTITSHTQRILDTLMSSSKHGADFMRSMAHTTRLDAEGLYNALKQMCHEKKGYLSKKQARALIEQYGADQVTRGVHVVRSRRNVRNPAGLLIVWLRAEYGSNARLASAY